jgi:hypothetical protein
MAKFFRNNKIILVLVYALVAIGILSMRFERIPLIVSMGGDYSTKYTAGLVIQNILYTIFVDSGLLWLPIVVFVVSAAINSIMKAAASGFKLNFNKFSVQKSIKRLSAKFWNILVLIIVISGFALFASIGRNNAQGIPHVPDSVAYMFQAKLFASGRIYVENNGVIDANNIAINVDAVGHVYSQYPFGHPLLLAIGYLINMPEIIPSLLAAGMLFLIYKITFKLANRGTAFLAMILAMFSPLVQMNAADYMSHNSGAFFFLLFVYLFIGFVKEGKHGFKIGLTAGFLFCIRPYTAVLLVVPFLIYLLLKTRQAILQSSINSNFRYRNFGKVVIGAGIFIGLYLLYNYSLGVDPVKGPYSTGSMSVFGFSVGRPVESGLLDVYSNLILLKQFFLPFESTYSFLPLILYALFSKKTKFEYLMGLSVLFIVVGYFYYKGSWIMYGPRMWHEIVPILIILSAKGLAQWPDAFKQLLLKTKIVSASVQRHFSVALSVIALLVLLVFLSFSSINNWYFGENTHSWRADFTPHNLAEFSEFNYANTDLLSVIQSKKLQNALIFTRVKDYQWWHFYVPFSTMKRNLEGPIIYVKDQGCDRDRRIIELFKGREVYFSDYYEKTLVRYSDICPN